MSPDMCRDEATEAMVREVFANYHLSPGTDLADRAVRQAAWRRTTIVSTAVVATIAVIGATAVLAVGTGTSSAPPAASTSPVPSNSSSLTPSPSASPTPTLSRAPARSVAVGDRVPIPGTGVIIVVGDDGFCTDAGPGLTAAQHEDLPGGCWTASDKNHGLGTANTTVGSSFGWGRGQLDLGLAVDAVEAMDVVGEGVAYPGVVLAPEGKDWRIYYTVTPWDPATADQVHVADGLLVQRFFDANGNLLGPRPGQISAGRVAIPSGLRGAPSTISGCAATPTASDPALQLITGRVQSILVCGGGGHGVNIITGVELTPKDGSTFVQLAQALAEPDPTRSSEGCPAIPSRPWSVAVRTTDGMWQAHIPVDQCGFHPDAITTLMQRVWPYG